MPLLGLFEFWLNSFLGISSVLYHYFTCLIFEYTFLGQFGTFSIYTFWLHDLWQILTVFYLRDNDLLSFAYMDEVFLVVYLKLCQICVEQKQLFVNYSTALHTHSHTHTHLHTHKHIFTNKHMVAQSQVSLLHSIATP